ncbi:MAG: right-handed parallel beta-helix repeat-containing protein [Sandaracinaceae bacterium]|nr:right-handed parallel beta-helix repeat-containing protein [Sandaracinaceae bacterium]
MTKQRIVSCVSAALTLALLNACSNGTLAGTSLDGSSRTDTGLDFDGGVGTDSGPGYDADDFDAGAGFDASGGFDGGVSFDSGGEPDLSIPSDGRVFYVATDGDDSRTAADAQHIESPWASLSHALLVGLAPGDTILVRAGTYASTAGNGAGVHYAIDELHGTEGHPIRIWAYPGERPVLDLNDVAPSYANPWAMSVSSSEYVHVKGFVIKNLHQIADGSGVSRGFRFWNSNHCIAEHLEIYNMASTGFVLENSDDNLILNCDSHHNGDGLTLNDDGSPDSWDNADGFSMTGGDSSSRNVFDGCRAWLNSDDGWDLLDWAGTELTIRNSWSFWEGYKPWGPTSQTVNEATMTPGDPSVFRDDVDYWSSAGSSGNGEGFKLGGGTVAGDAGSLRKFVSNCLAVENRDTGFSANGNAMYSHRMQYDNCIAYRNDNDGFSFGTGWSVGIAHIFRNNWSWSNNLTEAGDNFIYDGIVTDDMSHNVWMNDGHPEPDGLPLTISAADFRGTSTADLDAPRRADGSLPVLDFLRLAEDSDLVNAGTDVGIPFSGSAPDIGAFEN